MNRIRLFELLWAVFFAPLILLVWLYERGR